MKHPCGTTLVRFFANKMQYVIKTYSIFFPYWAYIIFFTTTYSTVYENQTEVNIDIELQKATNPRGCYLCWKYEHLFCQENLDFLRNKSMNHTTNVKVHIGKYIHQRKSQVFNIDMVE